MDNALKIYIVEDMAISRASLERMIINNKYQLAGSAAKAETAWKDLQHIEVDLVLLDINLAGDKNGIWLAQQIRAHLHIPFVYLTAYGDQQTVKEVLLTKPNGFLMKPYQEPTLLTTISIAFSNFFDSQKETISSESGVALHNTIFIKDKYMRVKLVIKDIYFIKSEGNYLEIRLQNKTHVVRSKLVDFFKLLPKDTFYQTHLRYIININKIEAIGKDFITISNVDIPVVKKYKEEIDKVLSFL